MGVAIGVGVALGKGHPYLDQGHPYFVQGHPYLIQGHPYLVQSHPYLATPSLATPLKRGGHVKLHREPPITNFSRLFLHLLHTVGRIEKINREEIQNPRGTNWSSVKTMPQKRDSGSGRRHRQALLGRRHVCHQHLAAE